MFSKAQPSKTLQLLCLQSLSLAKYSIYCDFEGSAEQSIEFIVFAEQITEFIDVSNGLAEHI